VLSTHAAPTPHPQPLFGGSAPAKACYQHRIAYNAFRQDWAGVGEAVAYTERVTRETT